MVLLQCRTVKRNSRSRFPQIHGHGCGRKSLGKVRNSREQLAESKLVARDAEFRRFAIPAMVWARNACSRADQPQNYPQ
jgi:hypothetical protein